MKLEGSLMRKIDELKRVLDSREMKRFYVCKSCAIEVSEERALEHGFSCEECAEVYELSDNSGPIREAKMKVARVERNLKLIRGELEIIREKERKKRVRVDKKLAKEEAGRRAMMKTVRAAARKRINKVKKKVVKKKIKKVATKAKKVVGKKVAVKKKVGLAGKLKKKLLRKKR